MLKVILGAVGILLIALLVVALATFYAIAKLSFYQALRERHDAIIAERYDQKDEETLRAPS